MSVIPFIAIGGAATAVWHKMKRAPKATEPVHETPKVKKFREAASQKELVHRGHKKQGSIHNGSVKVHPNGLEERTQVLSKRDLPEPEPGYSWNEHVVPVNGDPQKDADLYYVYSQESRGDDLLV